MRYNSNSRRRRRGFDLRVFAASLLTLAVLGALAATFVMHALYPIKYRDIVKASCEEFGVSESLALAVIHTESGFDPNARSDVGAIGLMQIMPETFAWLQTKLPAQQQLEESALYTPEINIRYGVFFLSLLGGQFGEDTLAIAAYHAGQGRVQQWLTEEQVPATGCMAVDIPSAATGHYVKKVERSREMYRRLYSIDG